MGENVKLVVRLVYTGPRETHKPIFSIEWERRKTNKHALGLQSHSRTMQRQFSHRPGGLHAMAAFAGQAS